MTLVRFNELVFTSDGRPVSVIIIMEMSLSWTYKKIISVDLCHRLDKKKVQIERLFKYLFDARLQ